MKKTKAKEALRIAKELAEHAKCGEDWHNAYFGIRGKYGEMFPTLEEREAFAKTAEWREILQLRSQLYRANGKASRVSAAQTR